MIPLATTKVTILRVPAVDEYAEPYSGSTNADRDVVVSGIRAVIDIPVGRQAGIERVAGGEQTRTELRLAADPCDLNRTDVVLDELTGIYYTITWCLRYSGNGAAGDLGHVEAGIVNVEGLV